MVGRLTLDLFPFPRRHGSFLLLQPKLLVVFFVLLLLLFLLLRRWLRSRRHRPLPTLVTGDHVDDDAGHGGDSDPDVTRPLALRHPHTHTHNG